jgi:exopolysaccharide biosynthesis polyprenyl glycosylphosphotransferase
MHHKKQIIKYITADVISSLLGWTLFNLYIAAQSADGRLSGILLLPSADPQFLKGLLILPAFWLCLHYLWGFYGGVLRRSRLKELGASVSVSLTGTLIIFLFLISRVIFPGNAGNFFNSFLVLLSINLGIFYFPRLMITSYYISAIRKGRAGVNTLIIGSDKKAVDIYREINTQLRSTGNRFIGFININTNSHYPMAGFLKHLGGADSLPGIISDYQVDEVILALESAEHSKIDKIINDLDHQGLVIKAIPGLHDILTGRVRINSVIETPLIQISHRLMPAWQRNVKYALDIVLSLFALILFLPLSVVIMIWVRLSSEGPVIYSHERIGKNGKPFMIYKFRTMIHNAEKNGPELSSGNDGRITRPGRFLRRTRMDEIPNFINVLKGEMSLVGPRPERRYYINQIMKKAPHYNHLLRIKPGITSWGQIRYGYAENVEQMIQRLKYDIIYLENMSVFVDFQILILTIAVIFKRNGV